MELLKETFALWVATNWIKMIKKEQRKLERMQDAVLQQKYVVDRLEREFLKRYPPKGE